MKHTKVVSKCCKAEVRLNVGVLSQRFDKDYACLKCGKLCDTQTITLTPDSEITEVLKDKLGGIDNTDRGKHGINLLINNQRILLIHSIAEQLNISLEEQPSKP